MRFAGSRMENFMNTDGPDYGQMGINNDKRNTDFFNASNDAQARVGATGIGEAGKVEAAGIIADAQAGLAQAQGNAAMMQGLGDIATGAIGAFGGSAMGTGSSISNAASSAMAGGTGLVNTSIGNVRSKLGSMFSGSLGG